MLTELGLTHEQFIDLCILCGCDYTAKIGGVGAVRALQLITKHGSIEKVLEALDPAKYQIPDPFPYEEARRLFKGGCAGSVDAGRCGGGAAGASSATCWLLLLGLVPPVPPHAARALPPLSHLLLPVCWYRAGRAQGRRDPRLQVDRPRHRCAAALRCLLALPAAGLHTWRCWVLWAAPLLLAGHGRARNAAQHPSACRPSACTPTATSPPCCPVPALVADGLIEFLVKEKTFAEERIRKAIDRINAAKGKGAQGRLESFFGPSKIVSSSMGKRKAEEAAAAAAAKKGKAGGAGAGPKKGKLGGMGKKK